MARVYGRGVRWELGWEGSARGRHGDGVQGGLDGASLPLVCLCRTAPLTSQAPQLRRNGVRNGGMVCERSVPWHTFHLQRMSLGAATSGDQGRGTRRLGAR
jgi:hypothetical protein